MKFPEVPRRHPIIVPENAAIHFPFMMGLIEVVDTREARAKYLRGMRQHSPAAARAFWRICKRKQEQCRRMEADE